MKILVILIVETIVAIVIIIPLRVPAAIMTRIVHHDDIPNSLLCSGFRAQVRDGLRGCVVYYGLRLEVHVWIRDAWAMQALDKS